MPFLCSIIATCSLWWDRSSQSQSWSAPTADISRLSVDLSLYLSASLSIKKTRIGSFWRRLLLLHHYSCWERLTAGHFGTNCIKTRCETLSIQLSASFFKLPLIHCKSTHPWHGLPTETSLFCFLPASKTMDWRKSRKHMLLTAEATS